jgi:hypothetical protein
VICGGGCGELSEVTAGLSSALAGALVLSASRGPLQAKTSATRHHDAVTETPPWHRPEGRTHPRSRRWFRFHPQLTTVHAAVHSALGLQEAPRCTVFDDTTAIEHDDAVE